jgi:Flp pilus assembly protein TadD
MMTGLRIMSVLFLLMTMVGIGYAEDVNDLIFQGSALSYEGKLEAAATMFSRAVVLEPDNEFAMNQLGLIHAKQEKFTAAAREFGQVLKFSPDNIFARTWVGVLLLNDNKVEQAREEFHKILNLDPANANAYYFLGVMYAVDHNMGQAVGYLRKAQTVGSDDPETHYRLAQAFAGMGMQTNARLEYERALDLSPKFIKALNGLGWLVYNQGDTDEGIAIWHKVLKINASDSEAQYNLAKVYNDKAYGALTRGNNVQARKWWEKTLTYEPSNKAAKYYLRKLE